MAQCIAGINNAFVLVVLTLLHLIATVTSSRNTRVFGGAASSFLLTRRRHQHQHSSASVPSPSISTTLLYNLRGGGIQTIKSLSEIQIILNARSSNDLVVLDFASNNCPPCEMIAPIYADLSNLEEFTNVVFCKVNVSDHPDVAEHYGVDGWPTFLLFKGGEVVDSVVGGQAAKAGLYGLVAKYA